MSADIINRIRQLMSDYQLNQTEFAYKAGLRQSNLSAILSGKRSIEDAVINKIVLSFDINKDWLVNGVGEKNKLIGVSEAAYIYDIQYMLVPFVSINARAGYLRGYGDQEYIGNLTTIPVIVDKKYKGKYRVFEVEGDSMDDGSYHSILDNDKILCREIMKEHWRSKLHINDWFFVIVHKSEGILVKEIVEHNVDSCTIKCHSLNPMFSDFYVNLNDVSEMYSVVKIVERNARK